MASDKHYCMQCMLETDKKEAVCPYCGYAVNAKQAGSYLPKGTLIGEKYLVGKMIKRNADSAVYIGRDTTRDKIIEIREFFPLKVSERAADLEAVRAAEGMEKIYDEYMQSFIRLWKNLMRFKGLPALFEVSDVFELFGTAYAVTDHNESTTFRKILDTMNIEDNPFSVSRTRTLIMSILSTVESLHTANVVHRGISPETLVLSSDGTLKITGFAIPQIRTTKNKLISSVCDGYAAIEQYDFNWQQGSWTDIYAIGALLYKMLTGRTLPPAPARLNDEEVFFTSEEIQRIPKDITELIKDCLVLMPQGRMKDIHDIINVFSPREKSKKTVTAIRPTALTFGGNTKEKTQPVPVVRATNTIISENQKLREKQLEEAMKPKEIVKPKQAQAMTKTTLSKVPTGLQEQKIKAKLEEEEEIKRREELYLKQRQAQQKAMREDEERRKQRQEELKRKKKENRRKAFENSAVGRAALGAEKKADEVTTKIKRCIKRERNPAVIAVFVGSVVCISCILFSFLLYGTVLYKVVDAPVLDNCLSHIGFLPVNTQNKEESVEYVEVADFKMLTKEYIENDALFAKRYNIVFEYDYCDTVEKGYVFGQSVPCGQSVPAGSTITVYISKGIEIIKFIDVTGMQYDDAEKALTEMGFTVTKNEIYNIGIYTQDKVVSASLNKDEEYPKGTQVTLNVWGAAPITLPHTTQQDNQQSTQGGQGDTTPPRDFFSFWKYILGL